MTMAMVQTQDQTAVAGGGNMTATHEDQEIRDLAEYPVPAAPDRVSPWPDGEVLPDSMEAATMGATRRKKRSSARSQDGARMQLGMLGISYPSDDR